MEPRRLGELSAGLNPIEMKTKLDAFAAAMEREPQARGWLFFYIGQNLPGATYRLLHKAQNYLDKVYKHKFGKLMAGHAGIRKESVFELWLVAPDKQPPVTDSTHPYRDYTAGFKWDEMYYLLESERAAMSGKEPEALDSNYFDNQSSWLSEFGAELSFPQSSRGWIIIYPKRGDPPDLPKRIAEYQKRYLFRFRGIDPAHITFKLGEPGARRKVELWLLEAITARKYAEFGPDDPAQTDAHLSRIASDMRSVKGVLSGSKVYVIVYTGMIGQTNLIYLASSALPSLKNQLIQKYQVDPNQVVLIDGGRQKEAMIELWLVPPDAAPPLPKLNEP